MKALLKINLRGEEREMLVTPFLFRVAEQRGIKVVIENPDDLLEVLSAYQKLIYCAIHAAHEIRKFDEPNLKNCDVTLLDIEVWAAENKEDYGKLINDFVNLLSGKTIKELSNEVEKKKKKSILSGIMTRLRSFF